MTNFNVIFILVLIFCGISLSISESRSSDKVNISQKDKSINTETKIMNGNETIVESTFEYKDDTPTEYKFIVIGDEIRFNDNFTYKLNPNMYGELTPEEQGKKLVEMFSLGKRNHNRFMKQLSGNSGFMDGGESDVGAEDDLRRGKRLICAPGCGPVNCMFFCPLLLPGIGCCPIPCIPLC